VLIRRIRYTRRRAWARYGEILRDNALGYATALVFMYVVIIGVHLAAPASYDGYSPVFILRRGAARLRFGMIGA
jgi:hypothetical protein